MDKKDIIDILETLNNGRVCSVFAEQRPASDGCEGCPFNEEEKGCIIEILIARVEDTI